MPHRDDGEASRARAEALARELEEVKAEREALRRENEGLKNPKKPAETPKPKPKAKPKVETLNEEQKSERRASRIGFIAAAVVVVGIGGIVLYQGRKHARERADYENAVAAHDALERRWQPLIYLEPCVQGAVLTEANARARAPATWDELHTVQAPLSQCVEHAKQLSTDDAVAAPARAALASWVTSEAELDEKGKALNDYVSHRDYKDDAFGAAPSLWRAVQDVLDRRRPIVAALVKDAFPALRELIRGYQAREEQAHGKSEAWWGIELGLELRDLAEIGFRASGIREGKPFDEAAFAAAIRPAALAWTKHAAAAPLEVRRKVRVSDGWATAKEGYVYPNVEWEVVSSRVDPLSGIAAPALPPVPPRPQDDD